MEIANKSRAPENLLQTIAAEALTFECADGSENQTILILSSLGNNRWVQKLIHCVSWHRPLSFKFLGILFSATGKVMISLWNSDNFPQYLLTKNIISSCDFEDPPNPNSLKSAEEYERPIKEGTVQCYPRCAYFWTKSMYPPTWKISKKLESTPKDHIISPRIKEILLILIHISCVHTVGHLMT